MIFGHYLPYIEKVFLVTEKKKKIFLCSVVVVVLFTKKHKQYHMRLDACNIYLMIR